MRSDDRPMARTGMDDKPVPRPRMDDEKESQEAPRAASASEADRQEARQQEAAKRERPMTAAERMAEENKKYFEEENKKLDQTRQASKALEPQAKQTDGKFWHVRPVDPNAQPFSYSNTSTGMIVFAATEQLARRMAMAETNDPVWEDENQVVADEFEPQGAMIVVRDYKG